MKNKRSQNNNKKGQQKVPHPIITPSKSIKNEDLLRKKLKQLLEKQVPSQAGSNINQKSNKMSYNKPKSFKQNDNDVHLKEEIPKFDKTKNSSQANEPFNVKPKSSKQNGNEKPLKKDTSKVPKKNFSKPNKTSNVKPKKSSKQNGNEATLKNESSKIPKTNPKLKIGTEAGQSAISKKNKKSITNDSNSKSIEVPLKRRLNEEKNPSKKSNTSDNKLPAKKQKLVNGKANAKQFQQTPKKKTDKDEAKQTNADCKKAKQSKSVLNKKKPKSEPYVQGRGPLRPPTSDSEFDTDMNSSPCQLNNEQEEILNSESEIDVPREEVKQNNIPNTEQALIRAKNEFEGSCSDDEDGDRNNSYLDFLFENTCNDSEETTSFSGQSESDYDEDDEEEEYSDESDMEYASGSIEDESTEGYDEYSDQEYWDGYASDRDDYFHSSSDDGDYQPPGNPPEDVYIAQGTAVKYELTTDDVGFDNDKEDAQIIELPTEIPDLETTSNKENLPLPIKQCKKTCSNDDKPMSDSDDSCPELIPIDYTIDNENFYSSSSESSHSCCSSCSCDENDENDYRPITPKKCQPMTAEIIKAKANDVDGMEHFFEINSNKPNIITTADFVLEELENSNSCNSLRFKVYTINNEVFNKDSLSSSKTLQSKVNSNNKDSSAAIEKVSEKQQTVINQKTHDTKKPSPVTSFPSETQHPKINEATYAPKPNSALTPSQEEKSPQKKIPATENSSPFYRKEQISKSKPSQPKVQIKTLFFNAINCNHVIVLLKDPLYIYGTVKLKLLAGGVNIFGYNPKRNEVLEIFSPRGYSSLKIEPSYIGVNAAPVNEKELLSLTPFFIRSDLEEILAKFEPSKDAILILERNDRSKKVNMLRKYMVEHLFPNMNSIQSDRPFYTSEFLLRCIITPNTETPLLINPDWNNIRIQNNSKTLIIGGKSVGKSTLLRYLINKNLNEHNKILLIDLDIGQPEMFVPQTLSATSITEPLLGPGYFLNKQPDKSFLVGHISIIHSLESYIDSLRALLEFCNGNNDYKDIPWIINTMGYNKGFGDELVSVICSLLKPSNIVQFESNKEINDFDVIMTKENVKTLERNIVGEVFQSSNEFDPQHEVTLINALIPKNRNSNSGWAMKPRDMRLAMVLTRLSSILIGHAEWITDVKPLCASIDDLNIIKMGDDQLCKEDLVKTLIGNLVYLCRLESGKAYECFGIGIVRGVDYPLRQIYLLPTTPYCLLENVNCLVICEIPLPSSILLSQGPKVKGVASYVYNTVDDAASMYIKHMYKTPQNFTGKRK
ncbi:uncharacterized protein LOC129921055 [Episyrphus balteatus]|uniref:uncharacterized protein LOC129921055 n=1 Tax=Episyrphus balteatus TaxID=286459 RepID=UPI0024868E48|nr:uncharacterized protein LOC129921055 [Episyrphus balteatus]XP_055858665.1 uncharacterized protein LOC129921055 [Episyrphus balteatus]XP_055858666.1 uncharacterized protein LOC129921055 [Episyrphus balteatus]